MTEAQKALLKAITSYAELIYSDDIYLKHLLKDLKELNNLNI